MRLSCLVTLVTKGAGLQKNYPTLQDDCTGFPTYRNYQYQTRVSIPNAFCITQLPKGLFGS
jgi:hypothetical protein